MRAPLLTRPSRRTTALLIVGLALVTGSVWTKPRIDDQNHQAERWVSSATTVLDYDSTAHLRLLASTSPWASQITRDSTADLNALARHVASTAPPGAAANDADSCWANQKTMWWSPAADRAAKACRVLAKHLIDYARMDVLNAYAEAIEQVCGDTSVTAAYPMSAHFPFRSPAVSANLAQIDARLATAPPTCLPDPAAPAPPRATAPTEEGDIE